MSVFHWLAIATIVITASARLTRLLIADKFPPVKWVRDHYENATDGTSWQLLTMCPYCMSFWVTALVVASGYFSGWHLVWWLVCGSLGASYLAAIMVRFDGDEDDD